MGTILAALVAGGVLLLVISVPLLIRSYSRSHDSYSASSLKTLATAEADFRSNDRDGNLVFDYWTADVYGLWALVPVREGENEVPGDTEDGQRIIRLIEPSIAGADGLSRMGTYGSLTVRAGIVNGSPKAGHVYRAFGRDSAGTLWEDTDGPAYYGAVHHRSRFAFAAMPDNLSVGTKLFIISADNSIWKYALRDSYGMDFEPMHGSSDSSSSVTGTGRPEFDFAGPGTGAYPADPAAAGCAKMD
jgi:hypothetical protein